MNKKVDTTFSLQDINKGIILQLNIILRFIKFIQMYTIQCVLYSNIKNEVVNYL